MREEHYAGLCIMQEEALCRVGHYAGLGIMQG